MESFSQTCAADLISVKDREEFVNGAVLTKVPLNRSSIATLSENQGFIAKNEHRTAPYQKPGDSHLLDDVTDQIINISKKQTLTECLAMIATFRQKAGKHFYGALIREAGNKKVIMNPLHILTTLSIIENQAELMMKKYTLVIYIHRSKDTMDDVYKTEQADRGHVDKQLDAIMQGFSSKVDNKLKASAKIENGQVKVTYRVAKSPDEHRTYEHYLTAHQLMTKSVIAPYYGTSLIQMEGGSSRGLCISPFSSANIVCRSDEYRRSPKFTSVCTGSHRNNTMVGLRSLAHSNLSSPYNSANLKAGALAYASAMVNRAFDLYIKVGLVEPFDFNEVDPFELDNKPKYSDELLAFTNVAELMRYNKTHHPETFSASACLAEFKEIQAYKELNHANTDKRINETSSSTERPGEEQTGSVHGPDISVNEPIRRREMSIAEAREQGDPTFWERFDASRNN